MSTLREFEPEKHFTTQASQAALLIEAFESGDADYLADSIAIVAKARGITVPLDSAERSLPALMAVAKSLGVRLALAA